jgi:hypothetical protein
MHARNANDFLASPTSAAMTLSGVRLLVTLAAGLTVVLLLLPTHP